MGATVEMKVASVGVIQGTNGTVVVLREAAGTRLLVIGIGALEASSIAMELEGIKPPRPMTHDLLHNILGRLGMKVSRILISDLKDETFYALLTLDTGRGELEIDSRPSDAMALALRARAPIYCAEQVLEAAGISDEGDAVLH
ncbi:MAG: bifunctional nuclease family protein [Acetobacteraceae bacterium]|nr:bifunctional nuclease family protein [Acetobacteraceae bacterium]